MVPLGDIKLRVKSFSNETSKIKIVFMWVFFFKKLKRLNNDIRWNLNSFVIENSNKERENFNWFLKRNLRYGYSGNLIDQIIYGKFIGKFLSLFKSIYFLVLSLIYLLQIYKYENLYKSIFFVFRFFGRILGLLNYTPKKYI